MVTTFAVPPGFAFSLIELLVVIGIIALLTTIGLPRLKGFAKSNRMSAATRQVMDDLGMARLKAISSRTAVYMIFAPTNLMSRFVGETDPRILQQLTNLVGGPYTRYALVAARTVGDQPGQSRPQYLTDWKTLPEGVVFAPHKYAYPLNRELNDAWREYDDSFEFTPALPFPTTDTPGGVNLPYIAFNSLGQLTSQRDEILPLAEGSVFVVYDQAGQPAGVDVEVTPRMNFTNQFVRINWLTGRASLERPEMP